MKEGSKVVVEPHRHDKIFTVKGKEDALVTRNFVQRFSFPATEDASPKFFLLFFFLLVVLYACTNCLLYFKLYA